MEMIPSDKKWSYKKLEDGEVENWTELKVLEKSFQGNGTDFVFQHKPLQMKINLFNWNTTRPSPSVYWDTNNAVQVLALARQESGS